MADPRPYEIYAIKYGDHQRRASENFLGGDPHDGPMPMDYFVWVIKGAQKSWVVDTGFTAEEGRRRGRNAIRCPSEGLKALDVDPDRIEDVIITHMHYDHAGNHHLFLSLRHVISVAPLQKPPEIIPPNRNRCALVARGSAALWPRR